jgi:hypothetical protein
MTIGLFVLVIVIGTSIWVGFDAAKHDFGKKGTGTATWVAGCLLLWIIVFPIYLIQRSRAPVKGAAAQTAPMTTPSAMYRDCPHCKEPMRRDASVCPHCRQPSAAWRLHEGRWWFQASEQDKWQWFDEQNSRWVWHDQAPDSPSAAAQ